MYNVYKRSGCMKKRKYIIGILGIICLNICNYYKDEINNIFLNFNYNSNSIIKKTNDNTNILEYAGDNYITINNNIPEFQETDFEKDNFENYSDLDYLGRAGVAYVKIGRESMPTEKRGSIGMIKPTGWHTIKYSNISGKYLYNRCHLIGYQLTGQNDNNKNLITCTRNMNTVGMLEFENKVAEYIKNTNNHVLYRVTPIFENNNLLATGVQMEACSVEDKCQEIKFNVFVYNVQDGITIDYSNGNSKLKS